MFKCNKRCYRLGIGLLFLLGVSTLAVGANVWLPPAGALTTLTVTGASNATPITVSVSGTAPANGTGIWIQGVNGNLNANGFFIVANSSGSTFQLAFMYLGGSVPGSGTYSGGGTVTVLQQYALTPHPRALLDGPSGQLTASLTNTSATGKSNVSNPPYAAIQSEYNAFTSSYTTDDVDSYDAGNGWYFHRFAASALIWNATQNSTALTIAKYGIDHIEQLFDQPDNFYCDVSGSQCANRNNSSVMDYGSFETLDIFQAYSLIHGQLSSQEISTFANKILNDNDIYHNGLGMPGGATSACSNANHNPWQPGDCGLVFLLKHLTYAPNLSPGQETHYTADYGTNTQAGVYGSGTVSNPPIENLTDTKLFGDILTGLVLADDDPRAQLLLTQSYAFWYQWEWAWGTSNWTGFTQGSARYTCYRWHPYNAEIALMIGNSGGPNVRGGVYLQRQLAYYPFLTLPDYATPKGATDFWGNVYGACDNPQDAMTAPLAATALFSFDPLIPFVNYWYQTGWGSYNTSNWLDVHSLVYTLLPYILMSPAASQTNPAGSLQTQYLFKDTDYGNCVAALGAGRCYTSQTFDHAVSKSDWSTSATQVSQRAGWVTGQVDHYCEGQNSGCDNGSYHIYRQGYLLSPMSLSNPGGSADNEIQLGGSDNNVAIPSYAPIARWAGTDPSGDSQSRYAYWMVDLTSTYASSMAPSRINRHVLHFKKASLQDYIVDYDDIAAGANQKEAFFHYNGQPAVGSLTASYTNGTASRINSQFMSATGTNTIAQVSLSDGIAICASTNGSSCNTSATTAEWIAVHQPSTSAAAAMPAINHPPCAATGGNCLVVEIEDSASPKVAVLARQGALLTSASFQTSVAGTAQYVVAGLAAGSYVVTSNSAAITGSPFTVNNGDNTLYFEGPSGSYAVTQSSSSSPVPPTPPSTPVISSFTASPSTITTGQSSTLAWSVSGTPAPVVSIAPGIGTVSGSSVSVSPTSTTTYTLTVSNSAGRATQSVNLTVNAATSCPTNTLCVGSGQQYTTIQAAANVAVAGQTVLVMPGTYSGFQSVNSGTATAPISFQASGSNVIINSASDSSGDCVNIQSTDYVVVNGFNVTGCGRAGIRVALATGVVISNNVVTNCAEWGIFTGFTPKIQILNNKTSGTTGQHGIYVSNSDVPNDNPVIQGNQSWGNAGNGIQVNGDCTTLDPNGYSDGVISGALIQNNLVYGNQLKGFSLIDVQSSVIQNNISYNNGLSGAAGGIHLAEQSGCPNDPSSNNVIVNNTLVEPNIAGIRITTGTDNVVFNNIAVSSEPIVDESGGPNSIDPASDIETASTAGLFVNAASNNYQLASGSPAIGAGVASYSGDSAPKTDYLGNTRPQPANRWDSGAYEYVGSVSPPVCAYSISPATVSDSSASASGSVTVTTSSDCSWTSTSNATWLTIASGSSGTGNGVVNYSVAANSSTSSRTGTLSIAGQTFTVSQSGATQPGSSSATYSGLDTTTEGTWSGKYGADGGQIANDTSVALPSYASLTFNGASTYTWDGLTTDPRALQVSSGSASRIASTYFTLNPSFSVSLNLTDDNTHQVALYLLDWSNNGRSETIAIADAVTKTVLSTQSFTNFDNGQYAIWEIKGDVVITVTVTSNGVGDNPLIAAIFFGGSSGAPSSSATYSGLDTTTQGTWSGKYGADGGQIANDTSVTLPSYASLTFNGASTYTWDGLTTDPRALQVSSGSASRIASTYFTLNPSFSVSLNLTDGNAHRVALYLLDWSDNGRSETISIADAVTKTVLSTQSFTNFDNGQYAIWEVKGNVIITVIVTSSGVGDNPLIAAIFFG